MMQVLQKYVVSLGVILRVTVGEIQIQNVIIEITSKTKNKGSK